jgi:hypothetical protein
MSSAQVPTAFSSTPLQSWRNKVTMNIRNQQRI